MLENPLGAFLAYTLNLKLFYSHFLKIIYFLVIEFAVKKHLHVNSFQW